MLINSEGEQEELTCFDHAETTSAYYSCSITWQNKFHIFGGRSKKKQISRLIGYKLRRIGSLAFDLHIGSCSVRQKKDVTYIYLCFNGANNAARDDNRRCRWSQGPLQNFTEVALSRHPHRAIQTSYSESKLNCLQL